MQTSDWPGDPSEGAVWIITCIRLKDVGQEVEYLTTGKPLREWLYRVPPVQKYHSIASLH